MNVDKQVSRLREMADVLVDVVKNAPNQQMSTQDALVKAAAELEVPVSQLQYVLTFAKAEERLSTTGLSAEVRPR